MLNCYVISETVLVLLIPECIVIEEKNIVTFIYHRLH